MNLSGDPEIVLPRPGDAYTAFGGLRLVIGHVTPAEVTYCVRGPVDTGPVRQVSTDIFVEYVKKGLIEKAES
jgi:hypothetical protein